MRLRPGGRAEAVAHADGHQPGHQPDLTGHDRVDALPRPVGVHRESSDLAHAAVRQVDPLPHPQRTLEQARVGELLAGGAALDLEDPPGRRARDGGRGRRQQVGDPRDQVGHAGPGGGAAGEDRAQQSCARLGHQPPPELRGRREPPFDVRREEAVVVLGQRHRLAVTERRVVGPVPHEARGPRPGAGDDAHGQHVGGEPRPHRGQRPVQRGARPVDLVHEQQGRHAEPLERAEEDPGLRLHPLDGRQHQHRGVQDAEGALDLGDEVGVPRGVDDVDGPAGQRERHDRGLDRDTAAAFDRQAVGAGGAGVDRPRFVDDPREVQEPLGEGGLTGVDVGEDAQVERARSGWDGHT